MERESLPADETPSGALSRFVELFDAGRYWEAHEALEQAWRTTRSDFFHGLIIYASAFVHARRGNPRGVVRQLAKVTRYLAGYTPSHMGIDVAAILRDVEVTAARVHAAGMPEGPALASLIDWPKLGSPARRGAATGGERPGQGPPGVTMLQT